ncbi:hypothetical protein BGZ80_003166 [Entomortierella chlamydospora]|uniref:Uncharacterized protein n=1 Tax=Entomortierella chlamydospora TaxID=101097 RepID=A0A9P6MPU0_9FUNG|nr:hypothetical protein BGZ80_003166 [Entomortierella chlamydospora]
MSTVQNAEQGIFTLRALLQHIQNNMEAVHQLLAMQAALQEQSQQSNATPQDQANITNALQALIAQNLEFAQMQQNASANTQRSVAQSPRNQIPLPLTTKFKPSY